MTAGNSSDDKKHIDALRKSLHGAPGTADRLNGGNVIVFDEPARTPDEREALMKEFMAVLDQGTVTDAASPIKQDTIVIMTSNLSDGKPMTAEAFRAAAEASMPPALRERIGKLGNFCPPGKSPSKNK